MLVQNKYHFIHSFRSPRKGLVTQSFDCLSSPMLSGLVGPGTLAYLISMFNARRQGLELEKHPRVS
jgi:hypothetical protein